MTDSKLLKEVIKASGMTMVAIAEKSGIKRETLYNKINAETEFTASEISRLTDVLGLSNEERDHIFFAESVN